MARRVTQLGKAPAPSASRWRGCAAALESTSNRRGVRYLLPAVMLGAIAVLSLVPGEHRPHSYIMSDHYEHTLAYALTALVVAFLRPGNLRPQWLCAALVLYAGALEFLQTWVPGRTASPGDFIASGIGVALGFLIAAVVKPRVMRALGS